MRLDNIKDITFVITGIDIQNRENHEMSSIDSLASMLIAIALWMLLKVCWSANLLLSCQVCELFKQCLGSNQRVSLEAEK